MTIAYSALRKIANQPHQQKLQDIPGTDEKSHRQIAYQTACMKYHAEIKAVQKYFPGWVPTPPAL